MTKIKVFNYAAEKNGHLKRAEEELLNLGTENISYLPSGKPVAENCYVSISHSHGKCAVCVSENPVGIDIEKIRERNFEKIICKSFSDREKEYFYGANDIAAFYRVWTAKEAYSKISGDGLKQILSGIDVFSLKGYDFKTQTEDGFVLTVCEKTE